MTKFFGRIGYNITEESRPGVYQRRIVEKTKMGDVLEVSYRNQPQTDSTVDDMVISNRISIIANPFDIANIHNIVYVYYLGARWKVTNVSIATPRLTLTLGGMYNGPTAQDRCGCDAT